VFKIKCLSFLCTYFKLTKKHLEKTFFKYYGRGLALLYRKIKIHEQARGILYLTRFSQQLSDLFSSSDIFILVSCQLYSYFAVISKPGYFLYNFQAINITYLVFLTDEEQKVESSGAVGGENA
jgi:hypothetical protein